MVRLPRLKLQRALLPAVAIAGVVSFAAPVRAAQCGGDFNAFIASFSSPQGQFLAKLSAASVLAILPILLLGWFSQKQLVRGLTFGAVK